MSVKEETNYCVTAGNKRRKLGQDGKMLSTNKTTFKVTGCLNCNFKTMSEKDLLIHVKIHKNQANFRVPCVRCPQESTNLDYHQKHIKKCKESVPVAFVPNDDLEKSSISKLFWRCDLCHETLDVSDKPNYKDLKSVTSHCYSHIRDKEEIYCPICHSKFTVRYFMIF